MNRQPETKIPQAPLPPAGRTAPPAGAPGASVVTALYERLSRDDEQQDESNSIINQKRMLEEYAQQNGFQNLRHFTDDGVSGVTFERPGFQSMLAEIEAGNVGTVIVKDMSRFGRDYLQVGFYTEVHFRQKGVRFIAVSNNIDSRDGDSGEFAPFLNIMAEWYARDASRKLKSMYQTKGNSGRRVSNNVIYGYRKCPDDKYKWEIDPDAAAVVRRIFQMSVAGKGPFQIAAALEDDGIETPGRYMARVHNTGTRKNYAYKRPCRWSATSVSNILARPEYMGHTVNFRSCKESYKDKRQKPRPQEDWLIFENTHEAIVDEETWRTAQRCRKVVRRTDPNGESNPLTGLLYCADCGQRLYIHRRGPLEKLNKKSGNMVHESARSDYYCRNYSGGRGDCTIHFIGSKTANALILETIKHVSHFARTNEAEFVRVLREQTDLKQAETAKEYRRRIKKNEKRIAELDSLFRKVYEDHAAGKLNEKRFGQLSGSYEAEQAELKEQTARLREELERFDSDSLRADKFLELVRKYTDFTELTPAMLHVLLKDALTASYFVTIWKMLRKMYCVPSGITQNVKFLLSSPEIENILENSDFKVLLSQAPGDRAIIAEKFGVSAHQLSFVTHAGSGEGLLFFGETTIPFVDRFPKNTEIYRLLTTRPEDIKEAG